MTTNETLDDDPINAVTLQNHNEIWSAHDCCIGQTYYYNHEKKESTWKRPSGFSFWTEDDDFEQSSLEQEEEDIAATAIEISWIWSKHQLEDGHVYYFNRLTKESRWHEPLDYQSSLEQQLENTRSMMPLLYKRRRRAPTRDEDEENLMNISQQDQEAYFELLREKKVTPFMKFQHVLSKISYEPRFLNIKGMYARETLFHAFLKLRKSEFSKERKQQHPEAMKRFMQVLASPFALDILMKRHHENNSSKITLEYFCEQLDADIREELEKATQILTSHDKHQLFDKRLSIFRIQLERAKEEFRAVLHTMKVPVSINGFSTWPLMKTSIQSSFDPTSKTTTFLNESTQQQIFQDYVQTLRTIKVRSKADAQSLWQSLVFHLLFLESISSGQKSRWKDCREECEKNPTYAKDYSQICQFLSYEQRQDLFYAQREQFAPPL